MATLKGDDDYSGYGVLGTGGPWSYPDRDDNTISVNSVGVWGLLGTAGDISNIVDEVTNNPGPLGQPVSAALAGRSALSQGGCAVYGEVRPFLARATMIGFLAGTDPRSNQRAGVYGESDNQGVIGVGNGTGNGGWFESSQGVGVNGTSAHSVGVRGTSINHEGVHAETQSKSTAALAAYQLNPDSETAALYAKHAGNRAAAVFEGNVVVTGDIALTNADCAEDFDISAASSAEPGTVMVLDDDGKLRESFHPYDKRVAGVVSGAGNYKPGLVLDKQQSQSSNRKPIALFGKVFCKVDAQFGPIGVGDLLTTSPTRGHAMKAEDPLKAFGAVIGKALCPLRDGRELIPVLVALQ